MHYSTGLSLQSIKDLRLDPVAALRLVRFRVDVVDHGADVAKLVQVREKFAHIIGDIGLARISYFQLLLVELA